MFDAICKPSQSMRWVRLEYDTPLAGIPALKTACEAILTQF